MSRSDNVIILCCMYKGTLRYYVLKTNTDYNADAWYSRAFPIIAILLIYPWQCCCFLVAPRLMIIFGDYIGRVYHGLGYNIVG